MTPVSSWPAPRAGSHGDHAARPVPRVAAFQGERGAYADLALDELWGGDVLRLRCWDFAGVLRAVAQGSADAGILPASNRIVGTIPGVAEAIAASGLHVHESVEIAVRHALLALPGATLEQLRIVYSHPVALAQCGNFLARHPWLEPRPAYDTAGAAREVAARRTRYEAAIASEASAERYGLAIVECAVADRDDNSTRFVVVRREP